MTEGSLTHSGYPSNSLYVGDLVPDVAEALLFEVFNAVGPVASIRVCRDAVTRRSLGYAYVNFHNPVDAERALDTMNYSLIKDKPCRIMWSQRDPALRRSNAGNIFIKNLDRTIDNKALNDTFSAFGNILSCKVVEDPVTHVSKGHGFVHFETQEAADAAIERVNGMLLAGKKVFVGNFVPRKERHESSESNPKFNNIFVKNLPKDTSDEKLRELFEPFGTIVSVAMKTTEDAAKGTSSFGFVCYEATEAAAAAVDAMNGKDVDGKVLFVGRAQKKAEREAELRQKFEMMRQERANKFQGVNLYVKNLDDAVEDDKLREEFTPFGIITSASVMRDDKGNSRGFGFVCFSSPEEATKAVTEMNGRMLLGKPLYVAPAQRKEERKAQLTMQYAQRGGGMRAPAGMPAQPMYPGGAALFYTPGMPPQMQMPRPRWAPPTQVRPGYGVPAYMAPGMQAMPRPGQVRGARPPKAGPAGVPPPGPTPAQAAQVPRPRGIKYMPNVRNAQGGMPGMPGGMPPASAMSSAAVPPVLPGQEPLTASMLAQAAPDQQKQMLGERLFPLIQQTQPELAGKVTGMLLEMDNSELLHLLESPEALTQKVDEAVVVLNSHMPPVNELTGAMNDLAVAE